MFRIGATDDSVYDRIAIDPNAGGKIEGIPDAQLLRCPSKERQLMKADILDQYDALLAGGPKITADTVAGTERITVVARFGAGYDQIDLDACTEAGIIICTTPLGVRRPMATAALTHILCLTTRLVEKSGMLHSGQWEESSSTANVGFGLTGRTLGLIGFGSIGSDLHNLMVPFGMRHLVYDPYVGEAGLTTGADKVDLPTLLREADVVVVVCALTEETRHLIGAKELGMMKSTAYFVNIARGAIVDQRALTQTLAEGGIRAAGLDALDPEPIDPADPLLKLDNVLLTPHALGITDEMMRLCSEWCVKAALRVMGGEVPDSVINKAVLDSPKLAAKLDGFRQRYGGDSSSSRTAPA